jgi:hypothetical protein
MGPWIFPGLHPKTRMVFCSRLNPDSLQNIIEEEFEIPRGHLFKKTRKREIVNGRHLYCSIIYHTSRHRSFMSIASEVGLTNHTSILHAKQNVSNWLQYDQGFKEQATKVLYRYYSAKYKAIDPEAIAKIIGNILHKMEINLSRPKYHQWLEEKTYRIMKMEMQE